MDLSVHQKFDFKDRAALEEEIIRLGLDIPLSSDISALLESVSIAGKTLPNRLVTLPMEGADSDPSGAPSDLTFRRYRRFAEGGCGLVWFEAAAVMAGGRGNPRQLMLTPETRPAFKGLVEATRQAAERKFGPRHALFLILQLTHAGRFAKPGDERAPVIGQHNPVLDTRLGIPPDYPLITDEEIDRVQEYFIAAARLARQAGFDGVDLKACHGYLISELLASFNRPDSRYGGPFENRTRFLVETAQKIKEAEPGFVVTCRLNLFDALPFPFGFGVDPRDAETEDLSEPIELIKKLAGLGFPILSVTCGIPGFRAHYGRPYDKPLIGEDPPPEHPLVGISRWIRLASGAQAACLELPVVGGGYSWLRQFFPAVAAAVVRSRKTSLIGLGREGLAYPNWASDLAEKGRLDPRRVCLTCSKCSEMLRAGSRVGCAVRDAEVYAGEYRQARKKARSGRRVSREKRHQKK